MGHKFLKVILILSLVAPSQAFAVLENDGESTTPQRPGGGAPARPSGNVDPTCTAEVTRRHTEALRQCEDRYGREGATPNSEYLETCKQRAQENLELNLAECRRVADANRRESESLRDTHKAEVRKNIIAIVAEIGVGVGLTRMCCPPGAASAPPPAPAPGADAVTAAIPPVPACQASPMGSTLCMVGKACLVGAAFHVYSFLTNRNANEGLIAGQQPNLASFEIPELGENPQVSPAATPTMDDVFGSNNALTPEFASQLPPDLQNYIPDLANAANGAGIDFSDQGQVNSLLNNPELAENANRVLGGGAGGSRGSSGFNTGIPQVDAGLGRIRRGLQDKFGVSGVDFEDGGGGGGGFGRSGGGSGNPLDGLFGNEKREEGNVNGLTRTLASGESVGVAGDDLFGMVSRRYQTRHRAGSFLPPNAPASSTRRN
ncbi:MAG: hypothetical protein IT289_02860 [Oligoflexia bacterium]|nr:hypothetical protein [Oligoflexia bacterium]